MTNKGSITIELSRDEALIIFELLGRTEESTSSIVEDDAEQKVLWNLQGKLELILTEPFQPNYHDLDRKSVV